MSIAELYQNQLSEEGVAEAAIEKRAAEILEAAGVEDLEHMTEEEAQTKLAELAEYQELEKQAAAGHLQGRAMAEGFAEKLAEMNIDIPALNEKLDKIAELIEARPETDPGE